MSDGPSVDEILDLVDAVVYADVFDAPTTLDDLHRFARIPVDRGTLERELATGPAAALVVRHATGAYTLRGRERLAEGFPEHAARAEELRRRARRVGAVLRHTPFVRGLMLTGSVAAGCVEEDADVDLLVLVGEDRIGTVFALLGPVSRLLGRRVFCPNFYLSERALALETRNAYVGHELAQARSVAGGVDALRRANPWLDEMFPNLPPPGTEPARRPSAAQRVLEALLRGGAGQAIERRARRLAAARLRAHYRAAVPGAVERDLLRGTALRFHASDVEHVVPDRHAARRRDLAGQLRADGPTGPTAPGA